MAIEFRHAYDPARRVCSCPGDPVVQEYEQSFEYGVVELVPTTKMNLYDYIQSFKDDVDLSLRIARFNAGDASALNSRQGFYGDVSDVPETLADSNALFEAVGAIYDNLPDSVKDSLTYEEFLASFESQEKFDQLKSLIEASKPSADPVPAEPAPAEPAPASVGGAAV